MITTNKALKIDRFMLWKIKQNESDRYYSSRRKCYLLTVQLTIANLLHFAVASCRNSR